MTEREELYLLEAIDKMHEKPPFYKKVFVRYPINPYDPIPDSFDEIANEIFPHEELRICNHMSIEEWDQIKYDMEMRTSFFFVKYSNSQP